MSREPCTDFTVYDIAVKNGISDDGCSAQLLPRNTTPIVELVAETGV
ncbi:MAG: hypothetical protein ACI4KA_00320 [Oscillospiraceae bacterium]